MANTTIKISQLPNVGNLTTNTLFPVVSTNGTLITDKINLGNLANFVLTEAGNLLQPVFVSEIAYGVANAAQPNITSVGNLTGLTVTNLANLHIPGGTNGYVLQTNGNGNLNWTAMAGSGNGAPGGSNSQIQFNNNGLFGGVSTLTFDQSTATLNTVNIAASGATIYGNLATVNINVTGNLSTNNFTTTGNITANYFIGNGSQLTGITSTAVASGPNLSIQFNNDGLIDGNSNLTYNVDTSTLNIIEMNVATGGNIYEDGSALIIRTQPTHIFEIWGNDGATDYKWSFDQDGHLTLPGNGYVRGDVDLVQMYNNSNSVSGISLFDDFELSAKDNIQLFTNNNDIPFIWTFDPTGNLEVPGNITPNANISYDLGNNTNRFKDIYLANSTIYLGDATLTANGNSIVVDSITITGGNVGNIGNIASINLDGNVSNVLRGDGTWGAGGGGGSELVNGDNSFVLDVDGNVVFEGTPSGNAVNRGLVWDYGANANGVNSMVRQDGGGLTVRAWTTDGGGVSGFSAPVNIVTNQDANTKIWLFDGQGNLTLPGNLIVPEGNIESATTSLAFSSAITGITTGNATVIVTLADSVFGDPFQGEVTISSVTGTTEANGTWGYQATDPNEFQLYTDATLTTPVDGTTWTAYVSGGTAVSVGTYTDLTIQGGNVSISSNANSWEFDINGDINIPPNATSFETGRIQSANGYPTLLAYGSGEQGGPELTWANTNNVNDLGNVNIIRNTMYINDTGLTVAMNANEGANTFTGRWVFEPDGNLTLPQGGIVYETGIPFGGLSGKTIALKPDGGTNADQQLLIYPTAGQDFNHLHLTSGNLYNTELFLGDDDFYVKLANTGNIVINTNDDTGNVGTWTFDAAGNLTLPQLTTISDESGIGTTLTVGAPPTVIVISGADFSSVNLTYTKDGANSLWYPAGYNPVTDPYIEFTGGEYGIFVPGFVQALYVNTGTLNVPLAQWNINPPLGSVAPTAVYTYGASGPDWVFGADGTLTLPASSGQIGRSGYTNGIDLYNDNGGSGYVRMNYADESVVWADPAGAHVQTTGGTWDFDTTGNLTAPGVVGATNFTGDGSTLSNVATKTSGSWTLASGVNTVSISIPVNGTYAIWVNGNIPNGIITYTATAVITNTNVPVLGEQYAWYYALGNALVLTSIPNQFTGTVGSISTVNTYAGNTANVFTFGITNNSGNTAVVNYGYTKL
jgi:hypothetical protein